MSDEVDLVFEKHGETYVLSRGELENMICWKLYDWQWERLCGYFNGFGADPKTCKHNVVRQATPNVVLCVSCNTHITPEIATTKNYQYDPRHGLWVHNSNPENRKENENEQAED